MKCPNKIISTICLSLFAVFTAYTQPDTLDQKALQDDFIHFREILENNHCCLYEYTPKKELDSMFDAHYLLIDEDTRYTEFFTLLATITARIGCMHTSAWMPGRYYISKPNRMFPLTVKQIEENLVVTGSYLPDCDVPAGSVLLEINSRPVEEIMSDMRSIAYADALNPYFIQSQVMKRFSLFYANIYGLPDQFEVRYLPPGKVDPVTTVLTPTDHESVRKAVYANFDHPPLRFELAEEKNTAILTVPTFIYYDRVEYFRDFMDSCFQEIRVFGIDNLILDLRGNDGGDPFCSSALLAYLEKDPVPYFSEPYGKYDTLAKPLPVPEYNFTGNLYTLIDGCCGSTNGHFCALLKYNGIGKFIGTPSGATYKCNAGRNTEFRLKNSQMILTVGRSTYAAAVEDMPVTAIMPDVYVHETLDDFLENRDPFLEQAFQAIESDGK